MMYKEKKNGNPGKFPMLDNASKIAMGDKGGTNNSVYTKDPKKAAKIAVGYH